MDQQTRTSAPEKSLTEKIQESFEAYRRSLHPDVVVLFDNLVAGSKNVTPVVNVEERIADALKKDRERVQAFLDPVFTSLMRLAHDIDRFRESMFGTAPESAPIAATPPPEPVDQLTDISWPQIKRQPDKLVAMDEQRLALYRMGHTKCGAEDVQRTALEFLGLQKMTKVAAKRVYVAYTSHLTGYRLNELILRCILSHATEELRVAELKGFAVLEDVSPEELLNRLQTRTRLWARRLRQKKPSGTAVKDPKPSGNTKPHRQKSVKKAGKKKEPLLLRQSDTAYHRDNDTRVHLLQLCNARKPYEPEEYNRLVNGYWQWVKKETGSSPTKGNYPLRVFKAHLNGVYRYNRFARMYIREQDMNQRAVLLAEFVEIEGAGATTASVLKKMKKTSTWQEAPNRRVPRKAK